MFKKKRDLTPEALHEQAEKSVNSALDLFVVAVDKLDAAADQHAYVAEQAEAESRRHAELANRATAAHFNAVKRADKLREFVL